jgi:nitroreductase
MVTSQFREISDGPMLSRGASKYCSDDDRMERDMIKLGLTADEVLTTTRAVRKRLDFNRPVELSIIRECVEIAIQAPVGGNTPRFTFIVVTDKEKRLALAEIYRKFWSEHVAPAPRPGETVNTGYQRIVPSANHLAEHMHDVPVLMIACFASRSGRIAGAPNFALGSSVYPAVWSYMLAARERGLGTCMTTGHLKYEREAAEVLNIPYDEVAQVCMIPTAYTIDGNTQFRRARRPPVDEFIRIDSY